MPLPTKTNTATATHAVVQAVESFIQNQNQLGEVADLDDMLCELIDMHKHVELALKRVLQCIYRLLHNHNKWNVKFGAKLFHKLISLLVAGNGVCEDTDTIKSRQMVANVLACVQVHARKFPRYQSKFLLQQLWSLSLSSEQQPHAAQILVHLFDDFVSEMGMEAACSTQLQSVLRQLLQSELREERKSAYFLMRKLLLAILAADSDDVLAQQTLQRWGWQSRTQFEHHWSTYVTIMENLEEQQSHLVLPTLSTLLPRIVATNEGDDWLDWLRILYVKLLRDNNNILVLRWTLEYFLKSFTAVQLQRANILREFLAATNKTQLYNAEGYYLPRVNMERFLLDSEPTQFLEALATVQWRAVPLLYWLEHLSGLQSKLPIISKSLLLKISSCVRALQNLELREVAYRCVNEIFEKTIDCLSLANYLLFIETLPLDNDHSDFNKLGRKIVACNINEDFATLSKRGHDVIVYGLNMHHYDRIVMHILSLLEKFPKEQHGWWRFLIAFNWYMMEDADDKKKCLEFLRTKYDIDIDVLQNSQDLEKLQQHLLDKLFCATKEERSYVLERSVDCFVQGIEKLPTNFIEFMEMGQFETFCVLNALLEKDLEASKNKNVFPALLKLYSKYSKYRVSSQAKKNNELFVPNGTRIIKYAQKCLESEEFSSFITEMINISPGLIDISEFATYMPLKLFVKGLLYGEISTGDARIESAYDQYFNGSLKSGHDDVEIRESYWLAAISSNIDVIDELLRFHNALSDKKPRYFENSKEHRLKMRIAKAVLQITKEKPHWSDQMWKALLAANDQLNVSYIYECVVACQMPSLKLLLERAQELPTLKPSQQVSVMSVLHIYCKLNWEQLKPEQLQEVIVILLPQTMGAHFQTRLLAQLIIHSLAVECEKTSINLPLAAEFKRAVELTFGEKMKDYQMEIRLVLSDICSVKPTADLILYATNAPFDETNMDEEWVEGMNISDQVKSKLLLSHKMFKTKRMKETKAAVLPLPVAANANVQRKMNPVNDIYPENDLIPKADVPTSDRELIVIASLIDKLPNLGGLARTSEVLGVKTLILDNKAHVEKSDFKNLSMTAEKSLTIVEVKPEALTEFLLEKQAAGFKIVGAEQTAHSASFSDFKFPKKCVLLLGHEKHGIPVDLIGFLDYAVEIPQFGLVRSLNVHVTGSLFIWEYCKQHLAKH